jgi:hypothetical protein
VASDGARAGQANRLVTGLQTADEISYRTEIRVAALLRMRFVLTTLAGRAWVKQHPPEAKALAALTTCEELALPVPPALPRTAAPSAPPRLPALAEDRRRAVSIRPGWLGITFVPVSRGRLQRLHLPGGAATVTSVLPRSPAAEAGLRTGDIVAGAPGRPFSHAGDLRPFIAAAAHGAALALEVLRGKSRVMVSPVVGEAPIGSNQKR